MVFAKSACGEVCVDWLSLIKDCTPCRCGCISQAKTPDGPPPPTQPIVGLKTTKHIPCRHPPGKCPFGSRCRFKHRNTKTIRRRQQRRRQAKSAAPADQSPVVPSAPPADGIPKKGSRKTVKRRNQRRRRNARERNGPPSAPSADPVRPPTKLAVLNTASPVGRPDRKRARVASPSWPNPSAPEWRPPGLTTLALPTTPEPQSDSMTDAQAQPLP